MDVGHWVSPVTPNPSPGAYNLEYVTTTVAETVARYLERRDSGPPSDPSCIIPTSGTAAAMVVSACCEDRPPRPRGHRGPSGHGRAFPGRT